MLDPRVQLAVEELKPEIRLWMQRIQGDRKIYHHLFIHGEFQLKSSIGMMLLLSGRMDIYFLLLFIEAWNLFDAAIYQIMFNPRPPKI